MNRQHSFSSYKMQDENSKLRANVLTLIEDNNRLHEEIRSTFVSDMLRLINLEDGQTLTDKEVNFISFFLSFEFFEIHYSVTNGRSVFEKDATIRSRLERYQVQNRLFLNKHHRFVFVFV